MFRGRNPLLVFFLWGVILQTTICSSDVGVGEEGVEWGSGHDVVKRKERRTVVSTEYGEISAALVTDNINGSYLLHFFTLEPNSLFLPVVLHADMVFFVHTGSGKLSWTDEDNLRSTDLRRGDVYRLQQGSVFFLQSNLETTETERQKLRIHAIFANSDNLHEPATGPYSSIRDMVLGFDRKVLQAAFKVPEEVIDELLSGTEQPAIIHGVPKSQRKAMWEMEARFVRTLIATRNYNIFESNKKKKKESAKLFNLFNEDKDFENCNGWSTTVTRKKLSALKGSDIGVFMVNLTTGSMMGPHWNPMATEISIVLQGRGMVRAVCSSVSNETTCRNARFEVEEGDVFSVARFHPMAQLAFNNETFVFMGFSTSAKRNHPQFLAGQASVLRTLDRDVLAMAFNVTNATLDQILEPQHDSVILGCVSCAEEEWRIMEEEIEREREEAREREEVEVRRREEERRKEEEEEARRREEEEARRQEEERKRREEEEERKRREEEERQREKEEERQRKKEEARQREEEAARQRGEMKARQREEEAARERREEEARQREKEERQREEEEARQREEEAARREEEERRRQEEAAAREREEEGERQREEEAARREEEERRRQEEAAARDREEEAAREREEEAARQREEAAARHRREEEARRREEEGRRHRHEEEEGRSEEERAAEEERRWEEEAEREEEATRQRRERERQQEEEEGGGGDEEEMGWKIRART